MAYVDQRTGGNQRAAIVTTVALIQGAVIIALINGLAVHFIKQPPPPNPQTKDIPVTVTLPPPPPPPDDMPKALPEPTVVPPRVPVTSQPVLPPTPLPVPTVPVEPVPTIAPEPPLPSPSATATPRLAKPRNAPGSWATSNDYPARDLREGNQGVTRFTLAIDAAGRVTGCTVVKSSGHPGLDKAACDNVSRRARFEPATDGSGSRVAGSYTSSIVWKIPRD